MNLTSWDKALWAAGFICHVALLLILVLRRRVREFPIFTGYIGLQLFTTASAEGGLSGTLNEVAADFNAYRPNVVAEALKRLDEIGGPTTYNHYPAGWALAMNSPFKQADVPSATR
jgi:hypothetical protein